MDGKEKLIKEILDKFSEQVEEKTKNFLNKEEIEKITKDFTEQIQSLNKEELEKFNKEVEELKKGLKTSEDAIKGIKELKEVVKEQALLIEKNKVTEQSIKITNASKSSELKDLLIKSLNSDQFKGFENKGFKGSTEKMTVDKASGDLITSDSAQKEEKAVIPVSDHTGNVLISEVSDVVRDDTPARKMHVRDILNVTPTSQAQVVAGQVYDYTDALTLGMTVLAENAEAVESSFKSKENTWGIKRIAGSFKLSKRWFKVNGLQWVVDHVLAKIPDAMLTVEDFELLFGDGSGDHVQGLSGDAQSLDLAYATYAAASISSVATYNDGTQALITFAAAHTIKNGDNLTIAGATATTYNATHTSVEVVNAKQVIIDLAYVAEANTSAWTGSATSIFYHNVEAANEYDVMQVGRALLGAGEFGATAHVVNPQQKIQLGLLKNTTNDYLNIEKDTKGDVIGIGGLPLIATTAVPSGKFFTGDFSRNAVELREFTSLNIQFAEDVESKKKNEIVLIVEEEIIFPIYNPYWFIYGKFSTVKGELETPA